jgi:transposase
MWCIPKVTPEFVERMEYILDVYAKPYNPKEPLLCFDEKSIQLMEDTRPTIRTRVGSIRKRDYEYKRNGTANIFVTVEPKAGFRTTKTTERRTKADFAHEIKRITRLRRYQDATRIHIVLDNLNTHFKKSLVETFGKQQTIEIMNRVEFHYTPKHASWLNMAEVEIGILSRQCLKYRTSTRHALRKHIRPWQNTRNRHQMKIQWRWTKKDARNIFNYSRQD